MAAGRPYEQIDDMTVFDLELLFAYWAENPPADQILKAVYGIKTKRTPQQEEDDERQEIARIKGLFKKNDTLVNLQEFSAKHQKMASWK